MADLYLAQNRSRNPPELCVIKMMLPVHLHNPEKLKLFLREARLAAELDHPNIVRLLLLDRVDDYYFIAMEYISGQNLFQLIHRASRSGQSVRALEAAAIIRQACLGLSYAHGLCDDRSRQLCLVHRDISPSNLMISYTGQVKILDFGIASSRRKNVFPSGKILGKASYMPPEQIDGGRLDGRADLCSLGIVFWELLTGQALFRGKDRATIHHMMQEEAIPAPSSIRKDIPPALDKIALRAMRLHPRDRFQSAQEMAAAISNYGETEQLPSDQLLAEMLEKQFGSKRAQRARDGLIGKDLDLETLLFDDLEVRPPAPARKAFRLAEPRKRHLLWWAAVVALLIASIVFHIVLGANDSQKRQSNRQELKILPGRMKVESSPLGANIAIDGKETGYQTPALLAGFPLGKELIVSLSMPGYQSWQGKVRLDSKDERRINAFLEPQ